MDLDLEGQSHSKNARNTECFGEFRNLFRVFSGHELSVSPVKELHNKQLSEEVLSSTKTDSKEVNEEQ